MASQRNIRSGQPAARPGEFYVLVGNIGVHGRSVPDDVALLDDCNERVSSSYAVVGLVTK